MGLEEVLKILISLKKQINIKLFIQIIIENNKTVNKIYYSKIQIIS